MRPAERASMPRACVPLAPFSTLDVGGNARWFVRAETMSDIVAAHRWCVDRNVPLFVLGGGSNLVIADEGIDGLVLQIALRGVEWTKRGDDTVLRAKAGELWDDLVAAAVSRGLTGVECLSGIPGSVGGTPIQNVGAYGQEIAATLEEVTTFDRRTGEVTTLTTAECGFGYRASRFKRDEPDRFIVSDVTFRLAAGTAMDIYPDVIAHLDRQGISSPKATDVRHAVLAIRRRKGMVIDPSDADTRSVGSFFVNPVVDVGVHARLTAAHSGGEVPGFWLPGGGIKISAAWLIEHEGFSRGYVRGRVGLSSKHPLAIVNRGGATALEVLDLAADVKRRVVDRFGIWLRPEPVFAGFRDNRNVDYLREGARG